MTMTLSDAAHIASPFAQAAISAHDTRRSILSELDEATAELRAAHTSSVAFNTTARVLEAVARKIVDDVREWDNEADISHVTTRGDALAFVLEAYCETRLTPQGARFLKAVISAGA